MKRSFWMTMFVALAWVTLTGCGQVYVNIPPAAGDMATHDPNDKTARQVQVAALRGVLAEYPSDGTVRVTLPEGTTKLHYATMLPKVSESAIGPDDAGDAATDLHVRAIRVRGKSGEVDVVRDTGDQKGQVITVRLSWQPMDEWKADQLRSWSAITDDTLRTAKSAQNPAPPQTP